MPRIGDYSFGRVVIDGEEQNRDLIVLPRRVVSNCWLADGHRLALGDRDEPLGRDRLLARALA
jgi:hypothetical protein